MLGGHNPGIEELLALLTGEQQRMTTANFAKIKMKATEWSASFANKRTLDWIVRPKEM